MKATDLKSGLGNGSAIALGQTREIGEVKTGEGQPAEALALQAPDTTRAPIGEQGQVGDTRQVHGQLQVRVGSTARKHQGTRSKKLKEERIDNLGRLEQTSFGPLVDRLRDVMSQVRGTLGDISGHAPADLHAAIDAALEPHRPGLATAIQQAIRGPRSSLTKRGIDAMRASGADTLMMQVLLTGKLGMPTVKAEMQRLSGGLRSGDLDVADIKRGLVTADGLLQRFRLAGVQVEHGYKNNGPRDLLLSFASSLHR